ncbi:hypothetical protein [Enterobacter hormaechei]|uniref:hypothetical protein n=1 Tax=Enterobacter cloacae complex TaxID=354276 RepID=UPI000DCAEDAB|nr:hypothetical protein [Enterobacter hormaechei]RAZ53877.1 hypothetical protein DP194_21055 [Enterobacter hormaechei subsp. xiangfangensis]WMA76268.1 hypothetical protein QPR74_02890 [Enterobacter hormaechei]WMA80973.1 hypothetical protein QPR70_02895 [Enterobacter hormaechei]HCT3534378.1 hypothetical protein [Enterobacter hormaechei]HED1371637.1 hypothetical protein [Enterobacter hormaechei subsp. xiangfangensis]
MSNQSKIILLSLMLFIVEGCSMTRTVNKTLYPPADTKWVNFEVKNPSQYTKPFPLEVRYISYECMKKRISGFDGSVVTEPSYNVIGVPMQQGGGDIWKAKVAMTGGGSCKWTLSAVNVGIEYIDATHLGKDLIPGPAVGATVAFDADASRNGQFEIISGNKFNYSPKYYPVLERWSAQKNATKSDKLNLFGEDNSFFDVRMIIKDNDAWINYHPTIEENKKVEMIFPYEKKKGVAFTFVYPNGEKVSSREIKPDFKKLDEMKFN